MSGARYDAIVIGSGIGGLAAAGVLARALGRRVLVLEQHFKLGGFTHTFQRPGGFHWDVGLHYVGEMGQGNPLRRAMDFITGGKVDWAKMKDPFETFLYPDLRFEVPSNGGTYLKKLAGLFPEEEGNLRSYFDDLEKAAQEAQAGAPAEGSLALQTLGAYLKDRFKDERLKGLLASQWGDYGLPPASASFGIHATIVRHYLDGGYYPAGSSAVLAASIGALVREAGGELKVRHRVRRILVQEGRVTGVEVESSRGVEEISTGEVYSDAGAWATYGELLGGEFVDKGELEELSSAPRYGAVTLYLGLKSRCGHLGIHGQNFWIYDGFDHDITWEKRNLLAEGKAGSCYLSFPGLKDPQALRPTAEIIAPLDHGVFQKWQAKPWRKRGPDYEGLKARITEALLSLVESRIPGFRAEVDYSELSTPLSVEHFTGHRGGALYGFPATPRRYGLKCLGPKTPVKGLSLVGADAGSLGIAGSMMAGLRGVAVQHGVGVLYKILQGAASPVSAKLQRA